MNLTVYLPWQQILQQMCAVLHLPIVSVYTINLSNDNFKGYINVGITPDGVNSWISAIITLFHGALMSTEYAAMDSAADNVISVPRRTSRSTTLTTPAEAAKQAEQMYAASATYHQSIAEQSTAADQHALVQV
jgi:hypothetical protein